MAFQSLSDLRKSRGGFDKLMKEVEKIASPQGESRADDRFWQPEVDKAGNGYAVIRFLAPPKGEELPWVRIWNHGFQGPTGKWYIENSLTTLNKTDPVSEYNTELWNSGSEAIEDEKPINVFDFWEGANFKLKIRNVEGYRNYDKSEFESPSALSEDDSAIEEIWGKQYSLLQFLDEKNFKSYDELKKKFDMVMGLAGGTISTKKAEDTYLDEEFESAPKVQATAAPKQVEKAPKKEVDFDDDDESLSYFAKLAED